MQGAVKEYRDDLDWEKMNRHNLKSRPIDGPAIEMKDIKAYYDKVHQKKKNEWLAVYGGRIIFDKSHINSQRFKKGSQGSTGWSGTSYFASFLLSLELQKFLNDLVGVCLEVIIEMIFDLCIKLTFRAVDLIVALNKNGLTWYFLIEASLSLLKSKRS